MLMVDAPTLGLGRVCTVVDLSGKLGALIGDKILRVLQYMLEKILRPDAEVGSMSTCLSVVVARYRSR